MSNYVSLLVPRYQTPNDPLELAVLCGIDEGIDTAVGFHQHHGKLIQPAAVVDIAAHITDDKRGLTRSHAHNESAAYHQ